MRRSQNPMGGRIECFEIAVDQPDGRARLFIRLPDHQEPARIALCLWFTMLFLAGIGRPRRTDGDQKAMRFWPSTVVRPETKRFAPPPASAPEKAGLGGAFGAPQVG